VVRKASPLLELSTAPGDLERVEAALRASVRSDDDYLTEIASHLITAGGKRLRPLLAVIAARSGQVEVSDGVVLGGVAVELVHLGSLYHDDVMDEAETRRGIESVNARWGNLKAILAGDFLLARASELAASLGTEVAGLLARTIGRLCEGQVGELRHAFDAGRSEADYLSSIEGKTASLFSASCRIGAIVAGLPRPMIDVATDYGRAFGMAFQIADDVLDLTATDAELGKPAGHDLVEGVYTLPVIGTLERGGVCARELGDLLGKPLAGAELDKALSVIRGSGAVERAIAVGRQYADEAAVAAGRLGESHEARAMAAAPHDLLDALAR
jgi:heptaprenyl diphosphate synthase